uniref:Uncharacterized protein n=1 Tax=viral metagenome TaxID=1070528 RepID=A0A6C0K1F6_9ZZZZ
MVFDVVGTGTGCKPEGFGLRLPRRFLDGLLVHPLNIHSMKSDNNLF